MNSDRPKQIESPSDRPLKLRCGVQHYAWGDPQFIPALIGLENPEIKPFAELWMGAHPDLPSEASVDGIIIPLNELIAGDPQALLGERVAGQFDGKLPFLFKILSAAAPLSIQTHPSKEKAEEGFRREDAAGVARDAPNRNYRDTNHKPELIAALSDFYGLRGFRPLEEIDRTLRTTPEFRDFTTEFSATNDGLRLLYEKFMQLSQSKVDAVLDPLVKRLTKENDANAFDREQTEYWVLRADQAYSKSGHRDRGLFSIFVLNLCHLKPGEALFLPAGVLHAYLEGAGVEIMANSNNVLRGGLTGKHVDVPELLANVTFGGESPRVIRATRNTGTVESIYETPVSEFQLRRLELPAGTTYQVDATHDVEILILIESSQRTPIHVRSSKSEFEVVVGESFFVPANADYAIRAEEAATLFKATVPA